MRHRRRDRAITVLPEASPNDDDLSDLIAFTSTYGRFATIFDETFGTFGRRPC
jgi:hypothetical protein